MEHILERFNSAYEAGSGADLAEILTPPSQNVQAGLSALASPPSDKNQALKSLRTSFQRSCSELCIDQQTLDSWLDVFLAYWEFLVQWLRKDDVEGHHKQLYLCWKEVTGNIIKGYGSGCFHAWTLPCLYIAGRWLKIFAVEADQFVRGKEDTGPRTSTNESEDIAASSLNFGNLEDAARVLNRMFTLCITDRAPMAESRKWALYNITNLLFKTYFKLNSVSLCKNPWRALQASHVNMPPIEAFPKSHICTFKYYVGLMFFLEEDYSMAERNLSDAYRICRSLSRKNIESILTYLIPCRLITSGQLPKTKTLQPYNRLQKLFAPITSAIRSGNLAELDIALSDSEEELVRARIYLTLERGRDICLRNLFRKVFIAGGYEGGNQSVEPNDCARRTRVPLQEFVTAVETSMGSGIDSIEKDEVECLLANSIYKGFMKGYIARERGIVVLSKGSAFPGTEL